MTPKTVPYSELDGRCPFFCMSGYPRPSSRVILDYQQYNLGGAERNSQGMNACDGYTQDLAGEKTFMEVCGNCSVRLASQ